MAKIKSKEILTYINITPESPHALGSTSATYALVGDGIVAADIEMNGETTEEQYIAEDSASTYVESYGPTIPLDATAKLGDDAFEFLDQLRFDQAIMGDAETDIVNVWNYETGGPTAAPAEQQKIAVSFDDQGGDGGAPLRGACTLNYVGDRVAGTFNMTTKVFTAS